MREFFINAFERVVKGTVAFMVLGVVVGAFGAARAVPEGAVGVFVVTLVGGILATVVFAGAMFLAFGIYRNTRETADALRELLSRQNG